MPILPTIIIDIYKQSCCINFSQKADAAVFYVNTTLYTSILKKPWYFSLQRTKNMVKYILMLIYKRISGNR